MNFTILSLNLIHLVTKSPTFAIPIDQSCLSLNLQNCLFKFSLSNLYYSNSYNLLLVSKTNFQFFLDTPIKIEETYVTNAHVKFDRVAIYDTSFICKDSTFRDCQSIFGQGGAISSLSSTILKNCFFDRCESELGGAIYSGSDIDYFSTSFLNCIGIKCGGCIFSDHPEKIIISFCTFSRSMSATGGALAASSEGQLTLRYNNVSTCGSFASNGAFDLSFLSSELYFIIFDQCFATKSTTGIRFFMNKGISIKSNLFVYMISNEAQPDEGAVLTIIDPSDSCLISHCSFSKTQKISGYTIYVDHSDLDSKSNSNHKEIKIINCCFTFPKDLEINNNTMITIVNETNQMSLFSATCDTFIPLLLPRKMGYVQELEQPQEQLLDSFLQKYAVWFISREAILLLIIGFAIGFLVWIVFIFLFKRRRRHRIRQRRAFQML